jgi:hypothetical protein
MRLPNSLACLTFNTSLIATWHTKDSISLTENVSGKLNSYRFCRKHSLQITLVSGKIQKIIFCRKQYEASYKPTKTSPSQY